MSQHDLPPDDNDEDYLIDPGEPVMSTGEATRPPMTLGGILARVLGFGIFLYFAAALLLPNVNRGGVPATGSDRLEWQSRQDEIDRAIASASNDSVAMKNEQIDE
jgi:hypothetical protein